MNKRTLIVIGVIIVLLLGGWFYMNSKKSPVGEGLTAGGGDKSPSVASNLKALIGKGVAQTCTYSDGKNSGTVYIEGGKVRSDFEIVTDKETVKSHMIEMNNTSYIWTDGQKAGFKMSFDPNATPVPTGESPNAGPSGTFDANANMNYKCSPGVASASLFTLPVGVTFSSFDIPTTSGSFSSQCSYCDALTGDDKTQCLKALNCN